MFDDHGHVTLELVPLSPESSDGDVDDRQWLCD